ncbi:invasion associated locus B family protein [Xanthobacter autotrophicus]|uniref:invasion associated locus B family protein n=1 Tax=Xanthobacter TaxID=279 RepID=UPI00145F86C3|nr:MULTISPECIES: invasion associated locus B family protein [Xanthobacter]NMN57381.1 invasion protein IalB [Xanthobacter sp. SG618]UDQ89810.1 invasion associated locus B family protein [Xanthobacter autotrophicus]
MTLPRVHPALLGMFLACAAAAPAAAQGQPQSKAVAQFGDWSVYVSTSSPKVCYAISQPKTRSPEGLKRDPAYFFISTRPGENVKNEVTVTMGFPLKEGSDATLTVGNATLQLYTKDQGAWVRNVADESKLVEAMKRGKDLTVASTSLRGNVTTDKYSLVGLGQAIDRVAQECK